MKVGIRFFVVLVVMAVMSNVSLAGAPLPLHCIEGTSGVFITSTAYMANPAEPGEVFGKPSFSTSSVFGREKDLQSFAVTENLWGKIELGYAYERLGLGEWASDVKAGANLRVDNHVGMHNLNVRALVLDEGGLDCSWLPAVTIGGHFKWNESHTKLNNDLNGLLNTLGSDHNSGFEFTAVASKTITGLLARPIIVTGGVRNGDAIHTGLLGFAGERRTTFEGSVIVFLTERLAFAAEYRQKPDLMKQFSAGGKHLVKAENDWMSLYLAYIINDNMTISGGYAGLGNIANNREDAALGMQLKYEF